MLTGQLPFKGEYKAGAMYSVLNEDPEFSDQFPSNCQQVLRKALAKNPDDRYQNIAEVIADLTSFSTGISSAKTKSIGATRRVTITTQRRILYGSLLVFVILILAFILNPFFRKKEPQSEKVVSVAVLYLKNLGPNDDEYYSYGITEDLIVDISKAGLVRIPAMNDILKYKESDLSLSEIANHLDVNYLLTGSFRKEDSRFRLAIQLVKADKGDIVWGERWEDSLNNISSIKSDVINTIVDVLGLHPSYVWTEEVAQKSGLNADVYELFLKGLYRYRHQKNEEDLNLARGFLNKAIELDSTFIAPKVILAESYMNVGEFYRAETILKDALSLAEKTEDYSEMASILNISAGISFYKGNYDQALETMNRTLPLYRKVDNKKDEARALGNIGSLHAAMQDYETALTFYNLALKINQQLEYTYGEVYNLNNIGYSLTKLREYDKALDILTQCVEIAKKENHFSTLANALENIGEIQFDKNDFAAASRHFRESFELFESLSMKRAFPEVLSKLALSEAKMGNYDEALQTLQQLQLNNENALNSVEVSWKIYQVYLITGNGDESRKFLRKAYNGVMKALAEHESDEQREKYLAKVPLYSEIINAWKNVEKLP
jgi:TolB-like protein/Tfp pilus assembly protein PilF